MTTKQKELIKLVSYSIVPIIFIALYLMLRQWITTNNINVYEPHKSIGIMMVFWIINGFVMCFISQMKKNMYQNIYIIISIIYIVVFGVMYLSMFFRGLSYVFNVFIVSEVVVHLWFACYLFCLIRLIKYKE